MKPDLAVTIVCGTDYSALANDVVPRVRQLLGLDVALEMVEPVIQPGSEVESRRATMRACCLVKLQLLERYPDRRLLFFDLDWVPLRRWDWDVVGETDAFVAVRSRMRPDRLNGGLWIASPKHAPIFRRALELWAQQGDPKVWTWEEPFLQRALNEAGAEVLWLPEGYNRECGSEADVIAIGERAGACLPIAGIGPELHAAHVCCSGHGQKLAEVRRVCELFPLADYDKLAGHVAAEPQPRGSITW